MAFTGNYICSSFKKELMQALHNFNASTEIRAGDTFKVALYDNTATLNASTTVYTTTGEVTGTNYTAGGDSLTNITPTTSGTAGAGDFEDYTFSNVTLTARGALVYNSTNGNRAVMVLDFGGNKTKTADDLDITFPSPDSVNAILLIK